MFPRLTFPLLVIALVTASPLLAQSPAIEVHFSPKGGCTDAIVKELADAKSTVLVQAYEFTSPRIREALVKAASDNKVKVSVILDKRQENSSQTRLLGNQPGIKILISERPKDHNKTIVIDGKVLITGSFNFSKAAEKSNAENLLVIRSPAVAKEYSDNWTTEEGHCRDYQRPQPIPAKEKNPR
jgi:phosphatidylserine/phosphatidylglycerophosphate/cardiolipin synthase-like enzyme